MTQAALAKFLALVVAGALLIVAFTAVMVTTAATVSIFWLLSPPR